jgi:hypothetical protein
MEHTREAKGCHMECIREAQGCHIVYLGGLDILYGRDRWICPIGLIWRDLVDIFS